VLLLFTVLGESGVLVLGAAMSDPIALTVIAVAATFMIVGALIHMTENARTRRFTFDLTQAALQSSQSGTDAALEAIAASSERHDKIVSDALHASPPPSQGW
jgi:hypothetical protein